MSNTTIRRTRPTKPIRQEVVEHTKQADSKEVIELLNAFVSEARNEFRKREKLTVKGLLHKTKCDQVTFLGDHFSLTIDFKGGMGV